MPASSDVSTVSRSAVRNGEVHISLEYVGCVICGKDDGEPVGVGEDFEYRTCSDTFVAMRCPECGSVYLNPRPAESEFSRIYPRNYHAFDFRPESFGIIYRIRRRLEARRLLSWCQGLPSDARILDVGCGDGFHLALLRDFGQASWRLEGLDLDERACIAARSRGLIVQNSTLDDARISESSRDLVLLVMTIEHVARPDLLLQRVKEILKPGGKVVVVTDNTRSVDFRFFRGRHWGGYHFPRHWNLFNSSNLAKLASQVGFETISVRTAMSPVNWVYSIRNLLDDWGAPEWVVNRFSLKSPVALTFFSLIDGILARLGRGSILHAILCKPEDQK